MHVLLGYNDSGTGTCKATNAISAGATATQRHLKNCRSLCYKHTPAPETGPAPGSKSSHQITTDISLDLPQPRPQTLHRPFFALLFLIPPFFTHGVTHPLIDGRGFCGGREQRLTQARETKCSSNHHGLTRVQMNLLPK